MSTFVDLGNDPRVRTDGDGVAVRILRADGLRLCPTTPYPLGTPGGDVDDFQDRDAPLDISYTRDLHMPWETDDDGVKPRWVTEDGSAGFDTTAGASAVQRYAVVNPGLSSAESHITMIVLGPEPAAGYECGPVIAAEAAGISEDALVFIHSDSFLDVWAIQVRPGGANLGAKFGPAAAVNDVMLIEVGTDPGSGVNYVFATLPDGSRLGPFAIPAGTYATNTKVGIYGDSFIGGKPIGWFEVIPDATTIDQAPLAQTSFTGSAGAITGHATAETHVFARTGSVFSLNGSGQAYLNTAGGAGTPNLAYIDTRRRDVAVEALIATGTGSVLTGVAAAISNSTPTDDYLAAFMSNGGALTIRKRVAGVSTTLATATGFTAGDATHRTLRMVVNWPTVDVYYDGASAPSLSYTLNSTDQSDLGGGARTRVGIVTTKQNAVASPTFDSMLVEIANPDTFPTYVTQHSLGNNYAGNTFVTGAYASPLSSDGTKQVIVQAKLDSSVLRWSVLVGDVGSGSFARTFVDELGEALDSDNHNACVVAIDGSGRVHICGNMHDDPEILYAYSDPGYDVGTWTVVTLADLGGSLPDPNVTYPQLGQLPGGDVVLTFRDKGTNVKVGRQLMYRFDHTDESWTPLGVNGWIVDGESASPGNRRGPYAASFAGIVDDDSWWFMWLWCRGVTPGTGDVPPGELDARYHDVSYMRTDDGGFTWTQSNGDAQTIPCELGDQGEIYNTDQNSSIDLDNTVDSWVGPSGVPQALIHVGIDALPWKHAYRTSEISNPWTVVEHGAIWRQRQLNGFAYDDRQFFIGRPIGQNRVLLYEATIGNPNYGDSLGVLYEGEISNGWSPQIDWPRLRDDGVLAFIASPSDADGLAGTHVDVPTYLVEFDVAQYLADGN